MMTRLIPYAGLESTPWKNGGGSTTEIACAPQGAGFEEFEWRLSLANITQGGPFSLFEGVDRTLALVSGEGVLLELDQSRRHLIAPDAPDFSFAGEAAVNATLVDGPSRDFNVMTRRARCSHQFGRRRLEGVSEFAPRGDVALLFLAEGEALELSNDAERMSMVRFDTVMFEPGTTWTMDTEEATVFVVDIYYR